MKKTKAIVLFSGGLDSILAAKLMLEQGIDLHALTLMTPFSGFAKWGHRMPARIFAGRLGIPITVQYLGREFVTLVKHPGYGYGKNMNPCIDCRMLFIQKAKAFMVRTNADFIITGEVVGERPMTQNKQAMGFIEKHAGLEGRVLRPLSAKLLPPTIPEQDGLIRREKLIAIAGRSRKPQIALAKEWGIEGYPAPAGGCLLTDPIYSRRLKDILDHGEDTLRDIAMLAFGRHFRLPSGAKLVVGRNEGENRKVLASQTADSLCFDAHKMPSPIALVRNLRGKKDIEQAAAICLRYSDGEKDEGEVDYWSRGSKKKSIAVKKTKDTELDKLRIKG